MAHTLATAKLAFTGRSRVTALALFSLGIALLFMWTASVSSVSADGHEGMDPATEQCIMDTLGYMPSSPDELTQEEMDLIGAACFGDHGTSGSSSEHDAAIDQCIIDVLGYLPSSPDELSDEEVNLVAETCFGGAGVNEDPNHLDEATQQCIIDVLGFLPESSEELTEEQMVLVGETCFPDEFVSEPELV
ncbi:MAG: hypothetical protein FI717_05395 [SAR202 cluster bacterium]|nr:hypothetical protein [SAR202 cluster bacterium]